MGFMALGFVTLWRGLTKPSRYAALLAGGLPVLAFPTLNLEFLGWCGLVPGLLVIHRSPSPREAAVRGWWFGAGFLLAALYWLAPNIGPALLLAAVVFGALWTGFGVAVWGLLRPPVSAARALAAIVVVPSCWVLTEWARSWQGFGGPWAVLGTSQWQHPAVLGLAAVGGVWLVSFALVAANTSILVAADAVLVVQDIGHGPLWRRIEPVLCIQGFPIALVPPTSVEDPVVVFTGVGTAGSDRAERQHLYDLTERRLRYIFALFLSNELDQCGRGAVEVPAQDARHRRAEPLEECVDDLGCRVLLVRSRMHGRGGEELPDELVAEVEERKERGRRLDPIFRLQGHHL